MIDRLISSTVVTAIVYMILGVIGVHHTFFKLPSAKTIIVMFTVFAIDLF